MRLKKKRSSLPEKTSFRTNSLYSESSLSYADPTSFLGSSLFPPRGEGTLFLEFFSFFPALTDVIVPVLSRSKDVVVVNFVVDLSSLIFDDCTQTWATPKNQFKQISCRQGASCNCGLTCNPFRVVAGHSHSALSSVSSLPDNDDDDDDDDDDAPVLPDVDSH